MKQKTRRKKGISPLIAAVLLIAFTVAIATLIAGWFSTLARTTTSAVTNKTALAVDCSSASINIREVYVEPHASAAVVRALVENNGFIDDMNISGATAYNSTGQATAATGIPITDFDRGETIVLNFTSMAIPSCPSGFDRVIVTTDCGGVSDTFTGTPRCST